MKKFLTVILTAVLALGTVCGLVGCGDSKGSIKVGAVWIGDSSEGYTAAHVNGITTAIDTLKKEGYDVELVQEKNAGDSDTAAINTKIKNLVEVEGCKLVFTNSYGHQNCYGEGDQALYNQFPDVTFCALTGDLANSINKPNYKNAFTGVYQSRYISGYVAGLKLNELVNEDKLSASNYDSGVKGQGNIKIGYVGAFAFAEVKSGYTAFFLGVQKACPNVTMEVSFTNSWSDKTLEKNAAKALIAKGCVIIGQHADTTGAPEACEEARSAGTTVYSVGYNIDMTNAAPNAALVSATNNWSVYYTYAIRTAITDGQNGKTIAQNWSEGYETGAVAITAINKSLFTSDPTSNVANVEAQVKSGEIKVFDTSKFTCSTLTTSCTKDANGHLTSYTGAYGLDGAEAIKTDGGKTFFNESVVRSAPYFDINIDGITGV